MTGANPTTVDFLETLPSFVKLISAVSYNPVEAFDCWVTRPTGYGEADYQTGARYFRDALKFAQENGATNFLSYVVASMARRSLGEMESGFLNELASRAAVSGQIELDDDFMSTPVWAMAAVYANIHIAEQDPFLIRSEIEKLFEEGKTPDALFAGAALHVFCRAAYCGSRN